MDIKDNVKTTREEIMNEAFERCLKEMYANSFPPVDFANLEKMAKEGKDKPNDQLIMHYYLSMKEQDFIIDKYLEAYGIKNDFKDHCDVIKHYFEEPIKDKYIERDGDNPGYRSYEHPEPLKNVIGEEAYNKVIEYLEMAKNFYRFDREEQSFRFSVFNLGPNSSSERVKEYWKKQGVDLETEDRGEDESYYRYYCGLNKDEYEEECSFDDRDSEEE
jgi:hypothetical protein